MIIDNDTTFEDIVTSDWFFTLPQVMREAIIIAPPNIKYDVNNKQVVISEYVLPESQRVDEVLVIVKKTGKVKNHMDKFYGATERGWFISGLSLDDMIPWKDDNIHNYENSEEQEV